MKNLSRVSVLLIAVVSLVNCDQQSTPKHTDPPINAYEKLTYQNNYFDVMDSMGVPDRELSHPEAPLRNTWMFYKKCRCAILLVSFKPLINGALDRKATHYVGTKGFEPLKTLHVAKEDYRVLLDAFKEE